MPDEPGRDGTEDGLDGAHDDLPDGEGGFFDDEVDDDLWGSTDRRSGPIDRRVLVGIAVVIVGLVVGFLLFGRGGGEHDAGSADPVGTDGDAASDATTQLTSQRAPYNADGITPSTLPPGAQPTGCGDWDSAFNFPPKEITDGVYIWSDFEGWHVRVAGTSVPELSGSVTGQYMPPLQGQTEGVVSVTPDEVGKRLTFTIAPGGAEPVGFDFSAGCQQKELTFDLSTKGASVPFDKIHLGSRGAVKEYPLVARRTLPPPG